MTNQENRRERIKSAIENLIDKIEGTSYAHQGWEKEINKVLQLDTPIKKFAEEYIKKLEMRER